MMGHLWQQVKMCRKVAKSVKGMPGYITLK
jgi:hypothetical protein